MCSVTNRLMPFASSPAEYFQQPRCHLISEIYQPGGAQLDRPGLINCNAVRQHGRQHLRQRVLHLALSHRGHMLQRVEPVQHLHSFPNLQPTSAFLIPKRETSQCPGSSCV